MPTSWARPVRLPPACQNRVTRASVSRFVPVVSGNPRARVCVARAIGKSLNLPLFSLLEEVVLVVLPHRIELWTSPLPRGCSTTELRQRRRERISDHAGDVEHPACRPRFGLLSLSRSEE